MRLTKHLISAVIAAAAISPTFASAQSIVVLDPAGQGVRAGGAQIEAGYRTRPTEQRSLSIEDAQKLLASTEGPAWRVYEVRALETCSKAQERKLARQRKKDESKNCREQREISESANKFAQKHGVKAVSSSLYTLTTVLLTTKADGAK